ncbi:la-related protein 6C [Mercurialis annua]|uniref:la-related protein 6C n=1 Tax=Mercurialis annua TaxID=3986 RepID=UPI00216057E4|nr:la-related protein 6C [Mercurialis annua]
MAQPQLVIKIHDEHEHEHEHETNESSIKRSDDHNNESVSFKFNAQAPEFVPRSRNQTTQMPISGYYYPCFHYVGGNGGSDWFLVGDQDPHNAAAAATYLISNPNDPVSPNSSNKSVILTDDLRQKILKQVEYQFSDMSLLANESMSKHISKDPEGYVPISVIASTKKMKSLVNNNHLLAQALQSSSKLVVSEDNKKVKRKIPFTEKDREELQCRTVIVENLPEDHSHQNLEKIFSVVGSVRTVRICHPQESNSSRTKTDFLMSNKLHALVEFDRPETAEKAVDKLTDERNWRKGLRVRVLVRCSPKSVLKNRKSEFDGLLDDEDIANSDSNDDSSPMSNPEAVTESNADENSGSSKKGWAKGRAKGRGRGLSHGGRGLLAHSPQTVSSPQSEASAKHAFKGPRMPDGTRGFSIGRGKPLIGSSALTTSMVE